MGGVLYRENAGITPLKEFTERERMMSFDQLKLKYKPPLFIQNQTGCKFLLEM